MLNLDDIPRLRKQLGLTQAELSKLSGVSQSLIAKLEAGKLEPSYTKVKAIIETLQKLQRRTSKRAGEIATHEVRKIEASSTVQEAAEIMHKRAISQLPVFESGNLAGSISEKTVLRLLSESKSPADAFRKQIREVMDEPFPTVSEETPVELLYQLLDFYDVVLVTKRDKMNGIVTKMDLLKLR